MEEKKHREGKGGKYLEKDNVAFGGEEKRRKKKKENVWTMTILSIWALPK